MQKQPPRRAVRRANYLIQMDFIAQLATCSSVCHTGWPCVRRQGAYVPVVFGPGSIVMKAENDAGAVSTYVRAGAQHDTHLLWLLVSLPISSFVQEMVVRLMPIGLVIFVLSFGLIGITACPSLAHHPRMQTISLEAIVQCRRY